ncbi:dihydropteroate synthase [Methanococcoides burtonii]|uniref:dihydropteroate synthase n=1 Tax=Methanococcoides burtonii (strain DSM 6242 / NBRC 107633 / OCM 468 / ACE-M) TaxID=259564 RepID=Q12V25_METBU|nr:dihydropteroate synthase [Methanococcoides burtonii]ABE52701.1 dihydropteroate synthase [Methanococcoides burtonii DSM 6242]
MVVDVDICGLKVGDEHPVRLMGVINLSRESFYKGSVVDTDSLLDVAHKMIDDGATIIDLGARSTWPLADPITKEVECGRLLPALELLKDNVDAVISVDTVFADIAEKAIENGADVVNDVAGFATDGGMLDVVAEHGCPAVVMAAGKLPGDPLGMDAIMHSLDDILIRSEERGIDTDQLILDPAIGKWVPEKSAMYDLETIDQFERLKIFEKPLLAAISRKSFIGDLLDKPATERLYGSLAAAAIVVQKGAHIIRTHDVAETSDVVQIAAAIRSRQPVVEENGFEVSVLDIPYPDDAALSMRNMGVTGTGSKIMKNKTVSRVLRISNITTTEALIIKQEILARGGDAALERDAVSHEVEKTDVIVIGTLLQVRKLADKLECQARNLPLISKMIKDALNQESDIEFRYLRQS